MQFTDAGVLRTLLAGQRWGCLATVNEDASPLAAMVAVAPRPTSGCLLLHLSILARHTRNLLRDPRACVALGEPHLAQPDPQVLARVGIDVHARVIAPDAADFPSCRDAYLERLPLALPRFGFSDFRLFELEPLGGQFVGGFARAFRLTPALLQDAIGSLAGAE